MQNTDPLIRTKIRLPVTRPELVPRPRLQVKIAQGLRGPLTLITAPAGFGKTTLVASCATGYGMPIAWLSLDKDDNQVERFLNYVVATLQEADNTIGGEAAKLLAAGHQIPSKAVLTSLINDLDNASEEISLVLDDYQFISNQAVHEEVAFLLEHCPKTFHLVIATRSDPPLPLARLRVRGKMVELRAADLRFTESEATQFLNDVMGLHMGAESVTMLEKRTEGWIAGLQMAALSMRDRKDISGFVEEFSGTNRYILDYLLEEVLAGQSPEIQRFLLYTSILERLTAPLCDAVMRNDEGKPNGGNDQSVRSEGLILGPSISTLEYLERINLFLVPLDDERIWYRYHHLFVDLLRAQLQKSLDAEDIAKLHIRAAEWHGEHGSVLEAINHASMASDAERVERFIKQNYIELVSRGEMSRIRFWIGKLSRELVYSRPWLCIYEAYSYAWFGELDKAIRLLEEAEKHFQPEISTPEVLSIQGHLAYVKSRITAMHGNIHRAIELCLVAREYIPASSLALQLDTRITLGYEYFLNGDFVNASQQLNETIRLGKTVGAVINTVAASCVMARLYAIQGLLHKSYDTYQTAAQLIPDEGDQHLGAKALIEIGIADLLYEWNDLKVALIHMKEGLALISMWDKADDLALAYITLARIHLAQANIGEATEAVEKAIRLVQTRGVFSEARRAVEYARVKLWLAHGDLQAANRWAVSREKCLPSDDILEFDNELIYISLARVMIAKNKPNEAIDLLSHLEENTQSSGRTGRLIEIMILEALAMQRMGNSGQAVNVLTTSLTLAEPEGYVRLFLDEGQSIQALLSQGLAHIDSSPLREYALRLLSQFDVEPQTTTAIQEKDPSIGDFLASVGQPLVEPLSPRELEVLHLIALGKTNQEIARQLVVARGTIKAHAASIYRKLDVTNRTEAVARARQLGILS
jgi:LuxR family maltose regulon positive regulatory protein